MIAFNPQVLMFTLVQRNSPKLDLRYPTCTDEPHLRNSICRTYSLKRCKSVWFYPSPLSDPFESLVGIYLTLSSSIKRHWIVLVRTS